MLGVVSFVVYAAIGLSITSNSRYQGFHDRLAGGTYVDAPRVIKARTSPSLSMIWRWASTESPSPARRPRSTGPRAGGRTPRCQRVERNAASTPDKPAYIDFSPDSPDRVLTWSAFDNAATNLAHRLLALGVAGGDGGLAQGHLGDSRSAGRDRTLRRDRRRAGSTRGRARGDGDSSDCAPDSWSAMSNGSPRLSRPPLTPIRRCPPWRSAMATCPSTPYPTDAGHSCPPSGLTTSS